MSQMESEWRLYNADFADVLDDIYDETEHQVIVTDPPFNIGYKYATYADRKSDEDYWKWLGGVAYLPAVFVHYPEAMVRLSMELGRVPDRIIQWIYPSNTRRQHRSIGFFGIQPDFTKVHQPYKNPNDKRVKQLIANGSKGAKAYDWWEINQVKNVSAEKTDHPCQMPLEVMKRIIAMLPDHTTIIDPFCGSGTTGEAVLALNKEGADRRFVGVEIDKGYFEIAERRLNAR